MAASPKLMTMGDTVYARDSLPGDLLMLDVNGVPVWDRAKVMQYLDPRKAKVSDLIQALIDAGLMKAE